MKDYSASQIRNIAIVGHGGDGKTMLTEAMLFNAGAIDRIGKVEDGSTVCDYDPEEIKRQISISAAVAPFEYSGYKVNVIDAPGFFDFVGEMVQAMHVADGAVIVVSAVSGLVVGAEKAWSNCAVKKMPRMFVVNQMDRENADYMKVVSQLQAKYGTAIAPIQIPIMEGQNFKGYVDIISMKAKMFDGKGFKDAEVPSALQSDAEGFRETVIEAAAESDDALMEKFFEGTELTEDEINKGLRLGVCSGKIVPVCCSAAAPNLNVNTLMDKIINYMPSPADIPAKEGKNTKTGNTETRECDESKPFSAQVFKTVADQFVGKLSLFKIYSGKLTSDMTMYNTQAEKSEKVGTIYLMRGKKQINVDKLSAGDIGAVAKLQYTTTGDTLCDAANPIEFDGLDFPQTCISLAVSAKKEGDEDKVFAGLHRLEEEDPTFKVEKNAETGDTLLSGMGEMHIEVVCQKLKNKFGVEAALEAPRVAYRETIRKMAEAEGKHKKQSGGAGQFGVVQMRFEPIMDGSSDYEFVNAIVGGVVPREYIPAVEKGLKEAMQRGVLAGYPMVGIKATLYDGKYHPVDSKEVAFKSAARLAYKAACAAANPVLLEPIGKAEVNVPDEYMGDIIGDMNRRRGRILGMNPQDDGSQQVVAEVPMSEMVKYATDLRSMTQSRGTFRIQFERYEELPGQLAAKVIEHAKKEADEDE